MNQISLPYNLAAVLLGVMTNAKLSGVYNIQRGRFMRLIKHELELFDTERLRLVKEEHAVMVDGKPVETANGGYQIKDARAWELAWAKLMKDAPIVLAVETEVDQGWLKIVKEVLTGPLCPEISGEAALAFDEVLAIVEAGIVPAKADA